jgi:hypothetical protein
MIDENPVIRIIKIFESGMRRLLNILTFVFIPLCLHLSPQAFSQVEQPSRFEVEVDWQDEYFKIISAEENGLFLVRRSDTKAKKGNMAWEITVIDTALLVKWNKDIYLSFNYDLLGYDYYKNKVFLLFTMPESYKDDHIILEVDMITGLYQKYNVKRSLNIQLTEFEILNNTAIFGGYFNNKPTILQYFFKEGKTLALPGFYEERSKLVDVHINDEHDILTVLTSIRTINKNYSIVVTQFKDDGTMIENTTIIPEDNTSLVDARFVTIDNDIDLIAGTYSNRNYRYSRGIFLAHIDENEEQTLKYYNYGELLNFFSYMKAKREKRVHERIKRKKIKGKKLKFNYRLLVHDILKYQDDYILVGEAYYPKYNSTSYYGGYTNYFPNYSSGRGQNNSYFAGYKYTHAVVIGFGEQGKLIWDNSFEINDITSYDLKQFVEVDPQKDEIVLLYNYENVIRSKLIKDEEVIEGKSFNDINLKFGDDKIENNESEFGGLESWYDDRFYAYGIQKIKNLKDSGVKLNRKVFFINKILYN